MLLLSSENCGLSPPDFGDTDSVENGQDDTSLTDAKDMARTWITWVSSCDISEVTRVRRHFYTLYVLCRNADMHITELSHVRVCTHAHTH